MGRGRPGLAVTWSAVGGRLCVDCGVRGVWPYRAGDVTARSLSPRRDVIIFREPSTPLSTDSPYYSTSTGSPEPSASSDQAQGLAMLLLTLMCQRQQLFQIPSSNSKMFLILLYKE